MYLEQTFTSYGVINAFVHFLSCLCPSDSQTGTLYNILIFPI